jgi:heptosyltransferase II
LSALCYQALLNVGKAKEGKKVKTLIIKLGASGDVVRTTTLLHKLSGDIYWITSDENIVLLTGNQRISRAVSWKQGLDLLGIEFDLVINLEDSFEVAKTLGQFKYKELFGAYLSSSNNVEYTENAREWFDLSLVSRFGRTKADELKLRNRKSYQELIFACLGYKFENDGYFLPHTTGSDLAGDVAIANTAGHVWPMKRWAFYDELKSQLEGDGYVVNFLPVRKTLLEHMADVQNHKYLVSGDTLPMHIALGSGIKCVTIFQCTSPWEIHDYGLQTKVVSPLLEKYFYKRDFNIAATTCIPLDVVYDITAKICSGCKQ